MQHLSQRICEHENLYSRKIFIVYIPRNMQVYVSHFLVSFCDYVVIAY